MRATVLSLLDRTPAPIAASLRSRARLSRAARPVVNYVLPREPREVTVRAWLNKAWQVMICTADNPKASRDWGAKAKRRKISN